MNLTVNAFQRRSSEETMDLGVRSRSKTQSSKVNVESDSSSAGVVQFEEKKMLWFFFFNTRDVREGRLEGRCCRGVPSLCSRCEMWVCSQAPFTRQRFQVRKQNFCFVLGLRLHDNGTRDSFENDSQGGTFRKCSDSMETGENATILKCCHCTRVLRSQYTVLLHMLSIWTITNMAASGVS